MKSWHLILFGILVFSPYFIRPDITYFDPYYYLTQICRPGYFLIPPESNIFTTLLPFIPCSIPVIKLILLGLFLLDLLIIQEMGKLFGCRYSGLLILLSPVLLMEATRFENEALALPFILASLFYFLKWRVKYQDSKKITLKTPLWTEREKWGEWAIWGAFIYLAVALGIWKGAALYIVAYTLPWGLLLFTGYILIGYPTGLLQFIPNFTIQEGLPLMIVSGGLLFTGFLSIPKKVKPQIWFFLILAISRVQFLVYLLPFLVFGLEKRIMKKYGKIPRFVYFIPFIWIITIFIAPPTAHDWNTVHSVIDLANETGKPIYNEWGRGYMYHYEGVDVPYYGWEDANRVLCECPGICVNGEEIKVC